MEIKVKRLSWLRLISSSLFVIILISPVSARAAFASGVNNPVSAQKTVTASAVVVPAHVAQLGFLISAIARDIPVQEGDSVKAGQTLMVLNTPDLQFSVTAAQSALHSAQAYADLQKYQKVENRRNGRIFFDIVPEEYRQRANVKVQQAQVALEIANFNLTQGTLTAPFDGMVASISVIPGEFVPSDQAVVTLATLNDLQLETTDLSERDVTKVKMGAPVDIFVEGLNEEFAGNVIGISPQANIVGGDVVFKITIAFDDQPENLLWGMTAEVTIEE
ncbi:MAG: efflux RND transporter periplasmic adaptor subunit [Chloroflexi bacterium]|nr:MAG: efflux RND transporter periplasmic adaptor subunit [Chloroflexota bacterium]RPI96491.1 MAG: efflux RND transporter periplasmic adaptor subunit [Chloroflexota bacterium]